ncbi:hypothetical protein PRUPE_3G128000 [Prunus persica]|uniref:Uncharacterized protein n=1 Tax=Prunus persica TaxID=3760 RepID=M5XLZ1_PRUPE|nr:hypothetical protein PRUPE_3G128000 [Prunus persica]
MSLRYTKAQTHQTSKNLRLKFDDSSLIFEVRQTIFWKLMIRNQRRFVKHGRRIKHTNNVGHKSTGNERVEARLASLLMESKEYSEALSVLSGLIKEVRRLVDKLLLVDIYLMRRKLLDFFPCQSTVRVSHRLPLVFFVVSELKHRLPLAFIARKR